MAIDKSCPVFVRDEEFIRNFLKKLLNRHANGITTRLRIEKALPELFQYNSDPTPDLLWMSLQKLWKEYKVIHIDLMPFALGKEEYEKAKITFDGASESLVREWLNLPKIDIYTQAWQAAVNDARHEFGDQVDVLKQQVIKVESTTAVQIVAGFLTAKDLLKEPVELRTLSARCFWGDSKFLDQRIELLGNLFPATAKNILPRKLLLVACLPERLHDVVIVENQDTFNALCLYTENFPHTAFVYGAGFKASAARARTQNTTNFAYCGSISSESRTQFEGWWFETSEVDLMCYFWGDLDYSGMHILVALKKQFKGIDAWALGYDAMLKEYRKNVNHSSEATKKQEQRPIERTLCSYADEVLLPLLVREKRFLDQEVIDPQTL